MEQNIYEIIQKLANTGENFIDKNDIMRHLISITGFDKDGALAVYDQLETLGLEFFHDRYGYHIVDFANAVWQQSEEVDYTPRIETSLQQEFIIKSYECNSAICKANYLHFTASDTSVDLDNDRFVVENLQRWNDQINSQSLPLTIDHDNGFRSEIGILASSEIKCAGQYCRLDVTAKLYDNNALADEVRQRAQAGRQLKFSVGANPNKSNRNWSFKDKSGVRNIVDSSLAHVSVVQTGANQNAILLDTYQKSHSPQIQKSRRLRSVLLVRDQ